MATTTKAAAPAKKSSGFKGMKDAWIILVICAIAGYSVWYFVMGNPDNFIGGDRTGHPANLLGTVYKGGFVVGLIIKGIENDSDIIVFICVFVNSIRKKLPYFFLLRKILH